MFFAYASNVNHRRYLLTQHAMCLCVLSLNTSDRDVPVGGRGVGADLSSHTVSGSGDNSASSAFDPEQRRTPLLPSDMVKVMAANPIGTINMRQNYCGNRV